MAYKINGTNLTLQPESGSWKDRKVLNIDGNGHPVYPPTRDFEMQWGFMSMTELTQILGFFGSQGVTGTSVVTLPQWNKDPYTYFDYTGCVLQEPIFTQYDNYYAASVRLVVTNIRT